MNKNINDMSRKELMDNIPYKKWEEEIICTDIIIVPIQKKHESGFRIMDYIACQNNKTICKLSGCSDILNLDGIGGYGNDKLKKSTYITNRLPIPWTIDCLNKSGLLRIFIPNYKLFIPTGPSVSNMEIYPCDKNSLKGK